MADRIWLAVTNATETAAQMKITMTQNVCRNGDWYGLLTTNAALSWSLTCRRASHTNAAGRMYWIPTPAYEPVKPTRDCKDRPITTFVACEGVTFILYNVPTFHKLIKYNISIFVQTPVVSIIQAGGLERRLVSSTAFVVTHHTMAAMKRMPRWRVSTWMPDESRSSQQIEWW